MALPLRHWPLPGNYARSWRTAFPKFTSFPRGSPGLETGEHADVRVQPLSSSAEYFWKVTSLPKLLVASGAKLYCMPTAPFVHPGFLHFHINASPESTDLWLTTPFIRVCIHRNNCWATDFPHHIKINSSQLHPILFVSLFIKNRMHYVVLCWVTQSCLTLCDPIDCSLPGSSVHWILQARILEWVAISFSRESSQPRNRTRVSCIAGTFFTSWDTRDAQNTL